MIDLLRITVLGLLSISEAAYAKPRHFPKVVRRDDLPVSNYTCQGVGFIPDKGCYPEIYRGNTTQMQAWGAYLDQGAPITLPASVLAGLPVVCATAANAVCAYIDKHISDTSIRGKWIFQTSQAPGCLVGAFLPKNGIPNPTYDDCYLHIDQPMRRVWSTGSDAGMTRVSVNVKEYPSLPATNSLVQTGWQGAMSFDVPSAGSAVNSTVSSWFMEA